MVLPYTLAWSTVINMATVLSVELGHLQVVSDTAEAEVTDLPVVYPSGPLVEGASPCEVCGLSVWKSSDHSDGSYRKKSRPCDRLG